MSQSVPSRSLIIVAAASQDLVAGAQGRLPWHAPDDLRHFRRLTLGHPIIMGHRTWAGLRGALDGRSNIVLSDDPSLRAEGVLVVRSLHEALLHAAPGPVFVIGGRRPWVEALPIADEIHLTRIHAYFRGDVHFPAIDNDIWEEASRRSCTGSVNGSPTRLDFIRFSRRSSGGARTLALPAARTEGR